MDPNDRFIFIHVGLGQKLIKYTTEGDLVKETSTKDVCFEEQYVDGIRFINEEQFVLVTRRPRTPKEDFCSLPLYDLNMELIKKILPRPIDQPSKNARGTINQNSRRMYYWETKFDTVYTVSPEGLVIATHVIGNSKNTEATSIWSVNEYGKYFFIAGFQKDERIEIAYDQSTGEMFKMNNGVECDTSGNWTSPTLSNDLFGIEPVFIERYDKTIERYVVWVFPQAIKDNYDLDCLISKQVRYPKIRDEIIRISQEPSLAENRIMILLKSVDKFN
jgi:hypothetical protein